MSEKTKFTFDELEGWAKEYALHQLIEWNACNDSCVEEEFSSLDTMMNRIGCKYETYSYDGVSWDMWLRSSDISLDDEPRPISSDGYFIGEVMAEAFNKHMPMLRALWSVANECERESIRWSIASVAYESEYMKAADDALQCACRDITDECESHLTEEYLSEMCENNDWLFDEDGEWL